MNRQISNCKTCNYLIIHKEIKVDNKTYRKNALEARNEILDLEDIHDMKDYNDSQLEDLSIRDRVGKVKDHSNSISDSQYVLKWFNERNADFIDQIKKQPLEFTQQIPCGVVTI